jgi:hypothetical protein
VYGTGYENFMLSYPDFLFSSESECCMKRGKCEGWRWYPDLSEEVQGKSCIFGKNYPRWMNNWEGFLFMTKELCCDGECTS